MFVYENSGEVYVGGGTHLSILGHHRSSHGKVTLHVSSLFGKSGETGSCESSTRRLSDT